MSDSNNKKWVGKQGRTQKFHCGAEVLKSSKNQKWPDSLSLFVMIVGGGAQGVVVYYAIAFFLSLCRVPGSLSILEPSNMKLSWSNIGRTKWILMHCVPRSAQVNIDICSASAAIVTFLTALPLAVVMLSSTPQTWCLKTWRSSMPLFLEVKLIFWSPWIWCLLDVSFWCVCWSNCAGSVFLSKNIFKYFSSSSVGKEEALDSEDSESAQNQATDTPPWKPPTYL